MKTQLFALAVSIFFVNCASANTTPANTFRYCYQDPDRQIKRSQELKEIVQADQDDRKPPIDWNEVAPRDEVRAKRVAEIFAEGCFKTADDYAHMALSPITTTKLTFGQKKRWN